MQIGPVHKVQAKGPTGHYSSLYLLPGGGQICHYHQNYHFQHERLSAADQNEASRIRARRW